MFAADSIAELAGLIGVPADRLAGTVRRYNDSVAGGEDLDFAKEERMLEPIATGPYYAAEVRPATVCFTAFGLRIDRNAQVLGGDGAPIAGLFAAGECTGGIVGAQYVGSGNSYANCLTVGRIAGLSAADAAGSDHS
jgi:succinate dehydrogenase/fumarate reductase flavoprotein subunit